MNVKLHGMFADTCKLALQIVFISFDTPPLLEHNKSWGTCLKLQFWLTFRFFFQHILINCRILNRL